MAHRIGQLPLSISNQPPPRHLTMCRYRITTYNCGHTVHSRVRSSQQCGDIPCSATNTQVVRTTTYHWCPPCNRGESPIQRFRGTNFRPRRNAPIVPSDVAAAVARENARTRRARNISVPEPASTVIPPPFVSQHHRMNTIHTHQTPARAPSNAWREAYRILGIMQAGKQVVGAVHSARSFLGGRGIIIFLSCALLFCFLLLYTFSFFVYLLQQLVLAHLVWRLSAEK